MTRPAGQARRRRPPTLALLLALLVAVTTFVAGQGAADARVPAHHKRPQGCGHQQPAKPGGGHWVCTFTDNFNGTSLDRHKWGVILTAKNNFLMGRACFVDSPKVIQVRGGVLRLSTVMEPQSFPCAKTKGSVQTNRLASTVTTLGHFSQTYGRYQIRAAFPGSTQPGLQSSLWLFPVKLSKVQYGTDYGEIDIAEFYSRNFDRVIPTLHYKPRLGTHQTQTNVNCLVADPGRFHTYTLEWTPQSISIWYDTHLCLRNVGWAPRPPLAHPAPFNKPFAVILTQAPGAGLNAPSSKTNWPGTALIDYVRVWK